MSLTKLLLIFLRNPFLPSIMNDIIIVLSIIGFIIIIVITSFDNIINKIKAKKVIKRASIKDSTWDIKNLKQTSKELYFHFLTALNKHNIESISPYITDSFKEIEKNKLKKSNQKSYHEKIGIINIEFIHAELDPVDYNSKLIVQFTSRMNHFQIETKSGKK